MTSYICVAGVLQLPISDMTAFINERSSTHWFSVCSSADLSGLPRRCCLNVNLGLYSSNVARSPYFLNLNNAVYKQSKGPAHFDVQEESERCREAIIFLKRIQNGRANATCPVKLTDLSN